MPVGNSIVGPGRYLLRLIIAAANAQAVKKTIRLRLSGKWYPTEDEMFKKGVSMKLVSGWPRA